MCSRFHELGSGDELRVGFNLGTGNENASAQHIKGSFDPMNMPEPVMVHFKRHGSANMEAIMVQHSNGQIAHGLVDVEKATTDDPRAQQKTFRLYKLSLDPKFNKFDEVKHLMSTLNIKQNPDALQDFWAAYLACLFNEVRAYFQSNNADLGASYWREIPLVPTFSVPSMWTDQARGTLRCAARLAGAEHVHLRDEVLCVGIVHMRSLIEKSRIQEGQCLLEVDCGAGTVDIGTIELKRSPSDHHLMLLRRVGLTHGSEAGAHMINVKCCEWIVKQTRIAGKKDFKVCCRSLGLSQHEFLRRFSVQIDIIKENLIHHHQPVYYIYVPGNHGARNNSVTIELPKDDLMAFYSQWLTSVEDKVRGHLQSHPQDVKDIIKHGILTGGGSKCTHFKEHIGSVLEQYGIRVHNDIDPPYPCAMGALLQHHFTPETLPDTLFFYVSQEEEYVPALHGSRKRAWREYSNSKYERGVKEVPDRLVSLMRRSAGRFEGARTIPQWFAVDLGQNCLTVELFHSEEARKDHSALCNAEKRLLPGIREYPVMFVNLPDLGEKLRAFEVKKGPNNRRYYAVNGFVDLFGDEYSLPLRITLMRHDYQYPLRLLAEDIVRAPSKEEAESEALPYDEKKILDIFEEVIWTTTSSHFVDTSTGTSDPPAPRATQQRSPRRGTGTGHIAQGPTQATSNVPISSPAAPEAGSKVKRPRLTPRHARKSCPVRPRYQLPPANRTKRCDVGGRASGNTSSQDLGSERDSLEL